MVKRMSDDDVMNYVYGKLFGDLDGIESHALFDEDEKGLTPNDDVVSNAEPASKSAGGMEITIRPLMADAQEGGKPEELDEEDDEDEDDEDRLKGIGGMSPLMAQLHGNR